MKTTMPNTGATTMTDEAEDAQDQDRRVQRAEARADEHENGGGGHRQRCRAG